MTPTIGLLAAGLRRRRLQGLAVAVVVGLSVAAATLSLTILVASRAPYERAFAAASGAHLVVNVNAACVSAAQLAETASAAGVVAAAGPWNVAMAGLSGGPLPGPFGGGFSEPIRVADRSNPDGPVDRLTLDGRWVAGDGDVVVSQRLARLRGLAIGDRVTLTTAPRAINGRVASPGPAVAGSTVERPVVVVGIAASISTPDIDAWLSPTDLAAVSADQPGVREIAYRVDPAMTAADLDQVRATIAALVPDGGITSVTTFLAARDVADRTADLMVPILAAFSVFGLAAAAFVVVNVIAGIVLADRRQIGLWLAVGVTPAQVVGILLGQVVVPALAGDIVGLATGLAASQPMLEDTTRAFGLPPAVAISPEVLVAVGVGAVMIVGLAAVGPAWRAGRGSATAALAGRGPSTRRSPDTRVGRIAAGLPVPPAVWLGVQRVLGRPLRTVMTTGAVAVGVAAVVFSAGTFASLRAIAPALLRDQAAPIRTETVVPAEVARVETALAADPDIGRSTSVAAINVTVAGAGAVRYFGYGADASWIGYALVRGRWFAGPGEVVASSHLLAVTGLTIGASITIQPGSPIGGGSRVGTSTAAAIVGEIFDVESDAPDDLLLRGAAATVATRGSDPAPARFEAQPASGVSPESAAARLRQALGVPVFVAADSATNEDFLLFGSVVSALGVVLIVVSLGGVFHTVLLDGRERAREIAILKAIGLGPGQTIATVLWSVIPIGLIGGIIGLPAGLLLTRLVLVDMGRVAARTAVPEAFLDVLGPFAVVLALSGIAIAVAGAWIPAGVAARSRIAVVLQAE